MFPGATWHAGVDLIAVERVVAGSPPYPAPDSLRMEEQLEAVRRFQGPATVLAQRLGTTERSIVRWRDQVGWKPDREGPADIALDAETGMSADTGSGSL